MAKAVAQIAVRSTAGAAVEGAAAHVFKTGTTEFAEIYDESGFLIDQSAGDFPTSDSRGAVRFRAEGGIYDIVVELHGEESRWNEYRLGLAGGRDVGTGGLQLPTAAQVVTLAGSQVISHEQKADPHPQYSSILAGVVDPIIAKRAVTVFDGLARYFDPAADYQRHVGISVGSANPGQPIRVAFSGRLVDSAWNWAPGPVYIGAVDGKLQQALPATGPIIRIGNATGPTELVVNVKIPIVR